MFSETIRARARGHKIRSEVLCEARFLSGTRYLHNGGGLLQSKTAVTLDDIEWGGLQGAARISGLGASSLGSSRSVTVVLNLNDSTIKALFTDQRTEVVGRTFLFWGQFYDDDLTPLDPKFHIYTGIGDKLSMQKQGPRQRTITLSLEDLLVRRRRSAHAVVSHADQQVRDPGSIGFIYQPEMADKILTLFDAR